MNADHLPHLSPGTILCTWWWCSRLSANDSTINIPIYITSNINIPKNEAASCLFIAQKLSTRRILGGIQTREKLIMILQENFGLDCLEQCTISCQLATWSVQNNKYIKKPFSLPTLFPTIFWKSFSIFWSPVIRCKWEELFLKLQCVNVSHTHSWIFQSGEADRQVDL